METFHLDKGFSSSSEDELEVKAADAAADVEALFLFRFLLELGCKSRICGFCFFFFFSFFLDLYFCCFLEDFLLLLDDFSWYSFSSSASDEDVIDFGLGKEGLGSIPEEGLLLFLCFFFFFLLLV